MYDDLRSVPEFVDLVEIVDPEVDPDLVGSGGAVRGRQNEAIVQDGGAAELDAFKIDFIVFRMA